LAGVTAIVRREKYFKNVPDLDHQADDPAALRRQPLRRQ